MAKPTITNIVISIAITILVSEIVSSNFPFLFFANDQFGSLSSSSLLEQAAYAQTTSDSSKTITTLPHRTLSVAATNNVTALSQYGLTLPNETETIRLFNALSARYNKTEQGGSDPIALFNKGLSLAIWARYNESIKLL